MAIADNQWPALYQGLQGLAQHCNSRTGINDIDAALQQSEQLTSLFLAIAHENSASVIAQLNLTPRQLPLSLARLVKMLALGFIFSRSYGWQAPRNKQFLQAIILPGAFYLQANTPQHAQRLTAKALQHVNKQHPLLPLLIASCNVRQQPPWQLHPDGPLLTLVNQLAAQLLPAAESQPGLEQLLSHYQASQDDLVHQHWLGVLQQLCDVQALPGRFAKERQTGSNPQNYWFISGVATTEQQQPAMVYAHSYDPASKTVASDVRQLPISELKTLSPQFFRDPTWLALLLPTATLLPAPAELLLETALAQSQYNQLAKLSLSAQVQQLETQPLLNRFLLQSAQRISRQHLPVNRLRHAISLLGQDALSDWVAQAELHQYCSLLAHPHQHWLEQLQQCLQQSLLLLSDAINRPLALSAAGVISRCACLSLWQQTSLANVALGRQVQGHLLLGQVVQQHIWQTAAYPEQLHQLLIHYQQPDWAKAALRLQSQQQAPLTLLLRLSWQLSLAIFCANHHTHQQLAKLLSIASSQLGLPAYQADHWQQQLMARSQCYYPLPTM